VKVKRPTPKAAKGSTQLHDAGPAGYEALLAALDAGSVPVVAAAEWLSDEGVTSWYDRGVRLEVVEAPSVVQATISEWEALDEHATGALKAHVAMLEADFDRNQDTAAVKEQLLGSWKLVLAPRADRLRAHGLAGGAAGQHARLVGHTQTYRKPDPMDILLGNAKKPFMETSEVAIQLVEGSSSTSHVYGGFTVGALSGGGTLDVVEYYSSKAAKAGEEPAVVDTIAPNSWTCTHVGPMFRVCKLLDGSTRVYVRVEEEEAVAEMSRLGGLDVAVDAKAKAAWDAEQAAKAKAKAANGEEEDDPNDNRPAWQKRIDKADGIKRTKNGTPIINHGPIGGGGGGPRLQQ